MSEHNEWDELERELRHDLRRVDASDGFASRVLARAEQTERPPAKVPAKILTMRGGRLMPWAAGAIAASLAIGIGVGEGEHLRRQRAAAEADRQFEAGLQVTGRTLDHTRAQLERAGVRLGN